jgi:hypothetical protein
MCHRPGAEFVHRAFAQEKLRIKNEKDEAEAKYKFALVDGRKEQVLPSFALHMWPICICPFVVLICCASLWIGNL